MTHIDRRTFVNLAAVAGGAAGFQAVFPHALWAQSSHLRPMKASLGSQVLDPLVCFFWIGMHKKLGYFEQEGLSANWRGVQNQTQAMSLLTAGQQEVGGVGASTLMGLAAKGTRVPLKVVFAHYQRNPYRAVVLDDSPIKSWKDVRGKKVGLLNLGQLSTKWYSEAAVRETGGDPTKDISFLPVGVFAPAGIALEKGDADLYVGFFSHVMGMKRLGFKIRFLPEPSFAGYQSFDGGMTVPNSLLDSTDGQKALTGFFRAVAKAMVFSVENPRAAQIIHYDLFPGALPKGKSYETAVEDAAAGYKELLALTIPPDKDGWFGQMSRKKWEVVAYTWMRLSREQIPDVGSFFTNDISKHANDFDHEAIRQQARTFKL